MVVAWGAEFRFFYNDRYRPILGTKHPASLAAPGVEIFPEVWPVVGPEFERVRRGEAFAIDDWLLPLDRNGYLENCWFTLSYSPIRDESGGVGGVLAVVAETTGRVEGERRLATLRELARRASDAKCPEQACGNAVAVFAGNTIDVPFSLIYLLDREGTTWRRVGCVGIDSAHPACVETVNSAADDGWGFAECVRGGKTIVVDDLPRRFGPLPGGPYDESTHTAVLLPLWRPGLDHSYGVLVAGVSPRRALDHQYRDFFELAADHIATAISNAVALEDARRRAEALAEIDRAKTAFFSNVSHEFRTPLTLMLGPTEAALVEPDAALRGEALEMVHRNQLRLLKLVNALLDFSRIESGRAQATYRPTDISALTRELAGTFRSAIEHAGLRFDVDCPPIAAPAYIDSDLWEKVVMNLLSNALKFTLEGSIRIAMREQDGHIELTVEDSGAGIPADHVDRVFERFHRVEGVRSRTHEGSGIGLALTYEVVALHRGEIAVSSTYGAGSTFTVRIPAGSSHLPQERLALEPGPSTTTRGAAAYVEEATRWLAEKAEQSATSGALRERILVADDNADMRDYLRHLLRGWDVETVGNGAEALERARTSPPDLVVTDVMMPELDGFGLLSALRGDPRTSAVPVLMLSARSGEEARVSGLAAGADDYVVKPFSARELIARVRSLLALVEARREAELQKEHLHVLLMQAPTPMVVLEGPNHVVALANEVTCRLWDRDLTDVLNRPLFEVLPELERQPFKVLLDQVFTTGEPYFGKEAPARLRRGDGSIETRFLNFVYQPRRNVRGEVEGIFVIAFDVTDEVKQRNELNALRAAEQSASRTKDEFLAMLGHELRNPLAPILTALQLMTLRGDSGAERERTVIDRQVRHLVRLVDDLLDVSRIARGKIDLRRNPIEIGDVVASAVEGASPLLEERHHHLELRVPRQGLRVNGDVTRLTQVVTNVITNAAKYTEPRGRISVTAGLAGDRVELRVKDNGIGIDPALLPSVFDMFTQDRQALDRSQGGLGLGLTIARSLIKLHGGAIEARSEGRGKGSEFIITLPAIASALPAANSSDAPGVAVEATPRTGRRVLVVDDNVDAARLIADALEAVGHETRAAFDGPAALSIAAGFLPDVVLLDLGLPLMDGFEVARQLRDSSLPGTSPVLVAVTGYGQRSDRERTESAGFQAHVVKPVDVHELVTLLDSLLTDRAIA
jgi:signal transduction histidine kinase/two-component SAPR family response regulator